MRWRLGLASGLGAAVVAVAVDAAAEPQLNVGVLPGLCLELSEPSDACFALAVRGDVMYGRQGIGDHGVGPALELGTMSFDDIRLAPGVSVQVPLGALQLVLSPGGFVRAADRWDVGPNLRAFIGSRSFNHSGSYVAAFGLSAGVDWGLRDVAERRFVIAAHLDGMWLALPWMALISWLSH